MREFEKGGSFSRPAVSQETVDYAFGRILRLEGALAEIKERHKPFEEGGRIGTDLLTYRIAAAALKAS